MGLSSRRLDGVCIIMDFSKMTSAVICLFITKSHNKDSFYHGCLMVWGLVGGVTAGMVYKKPSAMAGFCKAAT